MTVWLVDYDCGDYYCEGNHLVGVFATEEDAHAGQRKHDEHRKADSFRRHSTYEYRVYEWVVGKVEL